MIAPPKAAAFDMRDWGPGHFIPVSPQVYQDIQQFLIREALLLDRQRYREWTALLAEDVIYRGPRHLAPRLTEAARRLPAASGHVDENYRSILTRVSRLLDETNASAESQTSRARRFVTNITVSVAHCPDEYDVLSYLLVAGTHNDDASHTLLSAERWDRLRRAGPSYRIVRREILVDQTGLATLPNFAAFL
jgi:3-phenylpropionate/cinnamic acid dioxygenase small subunit